MLASELIAAPNGGISGPLYDYQRSMAGDKKDL